ncbi:MAG: lysophospholipid acyltransferase family protein [Succinatimonas sp.]|nr:lysophospholipid acyltransferase family protein [Succinatimonas sp.]MDY5722844.1 lysophospholipid acyltransferase family protein [Succinivibrio sp.]
MHVIAGIYRVIMAALYFAFFGIGALIISLVLFNVLKLFVHDEHSLRNKSRNITSLSFKFFVSSGNFLKIFDIQVEGLEKLKDDHGMMFIANHPTLIDVVIMISFVKNANCVVKAALKHNPFLRTIVKSNDYVTNDGTAEEIIQKCKICFKKHDNLIIFPEGTRTIDKTNLHFTHGFSSIAIENECKIRPIAIDYQSRGLQKHVPFYYIYFGKLTYRLHVLDCFDTVEYVKEHQDREISAISRMISKELKNTIASCL